MAEPEHLAFWAIATVAFFGFPRLGELLVGTAAEFTEARHLSWGDVVVDCNSAASWVTIHLRKSKCNQFGAGADILLGRTGCDLCPVAAILAYVSQRCKSPRHFFINGEGKIITKLRFITQLRGYLKSADLPSDQFAGHSFRIRAATTAAQVGMEDSIIQTLGRWHSAAFLRYIHTPHERLAVLSAALAK